MAGWFAHETSRRLMGTPITFSDMYVYQFLIEPRVALYIQRRRFKNWRALAATFYLDLVTMELVSNSNALLASLSGNALKFCNAL